MHTNISNAQLTVPGRREMSPGWKLTHWILMLGTAFIWAPVYLIHKHRTRNVRY